MHQYVYLYICTRADTLNLPPVSVPIAATDTTPGNSSVYVIYIYIYMNPSICLSIYLSTSPSIYIYTRALTR